MMAILTLSGPLTNILQAIGRADVPAKSLALGCGIKIGLNYLLIGIPSINVNGAVFGTAAFYLFCIIYNYAVLKKETGVKLDMKTVIIKPLIASVLCGVSAYGAYALLTKVLDMGNSIACLAGIAVAVLVYGVLILLTKTLVKNDILMLPKGEKIAKILEKYRLIV
jgi:stage V sporulation protein B